MKKSCVYLSVLLLLTGCVTTSNRADLQHEYYESQRQLDEALNKAMNSLADDINQFLDYKTKHDLKEKKFNRGLTQKQQDVCDIYQLEKTPVNKKAVQELLSLEQEYWLNELIEENKIIKEWAQNLASRRQSITEAKQSADRRDQQWRAINQQQDQLELRQDAAWGRLQDSIQKLGDDMYRRSRYPY